LLVILKGHPLAIIVIRFIPRPGSNPLNVADVDPAEVAGGIGGVIGVNVIRLPVPC
jgi:hypothetical protein